MYSWGGHQAEGEPERVGHNKEVGVAGGCVTNSTAGREACEAVRLTSQGPCSKGLTYPKGAPVFALDSWEVIGKVFG